MITYKQLRARLHEAVIKEAYGLYDSGSGDKKVHDLEIPEQLQTLNVYIANISNKEDGFNDSGFILRVKFVKDPNTHLYTVYPEVLRIDEG